MVGYMFGYIFGCLYFGDVFGRTHLRLRFRSSMGLVGYKFWAFFFYHGFAWLHCWLTIFFVDYIYLFSLVGSILGGVFGRRCFWTPFLWISMFWWLGVYVFLFGHVFVGNIPGRVSGWLHTC